MTSSLGIFLKIAGAFHSTKTSGFLKFRQLRVSTGTVFLEICTKPDNLAWYTQIFQKFSFHSTLLTEFSGLSVEWFASQKFNSSRTFWKLSREISVPFATVSKFSEVLVEWKAPDDSNKNRRIVSHHSMSIIMLDTCIDLCHAKVILPQEI